MKVSLKELKISAGRPVIFLNEEDAIKRDIGVGDRVEIVVGRKKAVGVVDIVKAPLKRGEVSLTDDLVQSLGLKKEKNIKIRPVAKPQSAQFIMKKMSGAALTEEEIYQIIKDIVENVLTEAEVAEFIVAIYSRGMSKKETYFLTSAMYKTGRVLKWKEPIIADKHSIGGVAANRTTPIVVSICAAAGVIMPKTSSRAITSAAGTADVVETITRVDLSATDLQKIVKKVGACLAWGGSLGLAPADDKLIRVERILKLDPKAQLLASILSKKLSVGSTHVLIDIPYGEGAKVSKKEAQNLKKAFLESGRHFNLKMRVVLTDGSQPIGNGIGPVLEMKDVLKVLQRESSPKDLETKALMLAGQVLEMAGKARESKGKLLAKEILESKKALIKFHEIIKAQGKKNFDLSPAKHSHVIRAGKKGKIHSISNKKLNYLAYTLGCPIDKRAGIYLYKHVGTHVRKGEALLTLYAETREKLRDALEQFKREGDTISIS